jgi:hypothetical protein
MFVLVLTVDCFTIDCWLGCKSTSNFPFKLPFIAYADIIDLLVLAVSCWHDRVQMSKLLEEIVLHVLTLFLTNYL